MEEKTLSSPWAAPSTSANDLPRARSCPGGGLRPSSAGLDVQGVVFHHETLGWRWKPGLSLHQTWAGEWPLPRGVPGPRSLPERRGSLHESRPAGRAEAATRPPGDVIAPSQDYGFLVVLRELKAPVDVIGLRLLQGWTEAGHGQTVSIGAAVHPPGGTPMVTQERAQWAMASARDLGGARLHVAPDAPVQVAAS